MRFSRNDMITAVRTKETRAFGMRIVLFHSITVLSNLSFQVVLKKKKNSHVFDPKPRRTEGVSLWGACHELLFVLV